MHCCSLPEGGLFDASPCVISTISIIPGAQQLLRVPRGGDVDCICYIAHSRTGAVSNCLCSTGQSPGLCAPRLCCWNYIVSTLSPQWNLFSPGSQRAHRAPSAPDFSWFLAKLSFLLQLGLSSWFAGLLAAEPRRGRQSTANGRSVRELPWVCPIRPLQRSFLGEPKPVALPGAFPLLLLPLLSLHMLLPSSPSSSLPSLSPCASPSSSTASESMSGKRLPGHQGAQPPITEGDRDDLSQSHAGVLGSLLDLTALCLGPCPA